jgi:hypothetical protein
MTTQITKTSKNVVDNDQKNDIKNWTKNYNKGYKKLGCEIYNRPNLKPPEDKKIGGHCVIPNSELLYKSFKIPFVKELLKYK